MEVSKFVAISYEDEDRDLFTGYRVRTDQVLGGVTCEVYSHPDNQEIDLGFVTKQPGYKTPLQRVVGGDKTIKGWIYGKGIFTVITKDGERIVNEVGTPEATEFSEVVGVGEQMQWEAAVDSTLVIFEICSPPYQDGRFENIDETV